MKILITKPVPEIAIGMLKAQGYTLTVIDDHKLLTPAELIELSQQHDALLCVGFYRLDEAFFKACSHLKVVSLFSVGYNNVDLVAATKFGIPVGNTPDVLSNATADTAFLLMLATARKAFYMHRRVLSSEWKSFSAVANLGVELDNKTLGIFGLGRIGTAMAKKCKGAYNMQIIYHNRHQNKEAEKLLGATYVSFDELLQQSDVLSVHAALTPETKEIFNNEAFNKMKPGAIFINTARGELHQEQHLKEALLKGTIWGAGLDVTNPEPMEADNPLLFMPSVAVLPHIGSATVEARNGMAVYAAENAIAGLQGKPLPHLVNTNVYNNKNE